MNSAHNAPAATLQALLQHEQQLRDYAALRHRQAESAEQRARDQAQQLLTYRSEYEARWAAQSGAGATPQILHCYRSFMQRLDQAVTQQSRQVAAADAHLVQARAALLDAERRVAAVRKLIERRAAELQRSGRRHEQKQNDELAQRMRWHADSHAHSPQPDPSLP